MNIIYKSAGVLLLSALLMTGCKDDSKKYEARDAGIVQLNEGNYDGAIQSFDQALELSDGMVGTFELDVLKYRAEAEYNVEDYEAAAHTYGVLMQVEEASPEYLNMQCLLYMKAGQLDQAVEAYQTSYALNPGTAVTEPALLSLGQELTKADRFDEAMALYEQAVTDGLQSSELFNRMGMCEMEAGDCDKALEYFDRGAAIGDTGVLPKLLYNQAAAYEQKLDFAKALELLQSYVSAYGSNEEVEREIAFLKTR